MATKKKTPLPYHVDGCTCEECAKQAEPTLTVSAGAQDVIQNEVKAIGRALGIRTRGNVYAQMVAAAGDFAKAGLGKDGTNEQQKYKFRGIDALMDLAAPIFVKHQLLVLPRVVGRTVEERQTRNGGVLYSVSLEVDFTFVSATDGGQHTVRFIGEAMDSGDKASNKAMSAAYKYCLLQCFCIPVDAQDEADQTTPEETVVKTPEGYDVVKMAATANAQNGSQPLRDYAKSLKGTPAFASWDYLVKLDPDWTDIKARAEVADKAIVAANVERIKAEGLPVPGEGA